MPTIELIPGHRKTVTEEHQVTVEWTANILEGNVLGRSPLLYGVLGMWQGQLYNCNVVRIELDSQGFSYLLGFL